MTHTGRILPEQLARELKPVLKVGVRPSKIVSLLEKLPGLISTCSPGIAIDDQWEQAFAICEAIEKAANSLGDGVYGRATRTLFGIESGTRGLLLGRRRLVAAGLLQVDEATLIRHWEAPIRLDLAAMLYRQGSRQSVP